MKSISTFFLKISSQHQSLKLFIVLGFILYSYSTPVKGQMGANIRNEVNKTLVQVSELRDSVYKDIAKISYKMASSRRNQGFYLDPTWQNSFIITKNEKVYHFSGRLNALNSAIEVNLDGDIRNIYAGQVKVAVIGNRTFLPFKGTNISQVRKMYAYMEVLSFGSTHLLVYYLFRSQTGDTSQLSPSMSNNTKFKIIPLYYSIGINGKLARLKSSKRKVLALFGPKREEMETYVKANKLRFSDKEDLTQIFDYFNGLEMK